MTKTLVSIQRQIEKLQKQASEIKEKEVLGVIERIKTAIDFYGLTPVDLFDKKLSAVPTGKRKVAVTTKVKAGGSKRPRAKGIIKYRDDAGNTWTGNGMRPRWFKAALESGKTAEDLLAKR